jgi:hypothetical protein
MLAGVLPTHTLLHGSEIDTGTPVTMGRHKARKRGGLRVDRPNGAAAVKCHLASVLGAGVVGGFGLVYGSAAVFNPLEIRSRDTAATNQG